MKPLLSVVPLLAGSLLQGPTAEPASDVPRQDAGSAVRVQFLATADTVAARRAAEELDRLAGPGCSLHLVPVPAGSFHRLQVGGFADAEGARALVHSLEEAGHADAWIVPAGAEPGRVLREADPRAGPCRSPTEPEEPTAELAPITPLTPRDFDRAPGLPAVGPVAALLPEAGVQERPLGAERPLRVFLDCQTGGCDTSFLLREITFVDWVRDREVADVHLLVTSLSAGSGRTFQLSFQGQGEFEESVHNLEFTSSDTDTGDERREGLARIIRLGLAPYVVRAGGPANLDVVLRPVREAARETRQTTDDPWNFWTFSTSVGAELNGQESTEDLQLFGSLSANRTTDAWKIRSRTSVSYNESTFRFEDREFLSLARFFEANLLIARSLGDHWSAGLFSEAWTSTFENMHLGKRGALALEWSVFPYEESSRREFTALYTVGYNDFEYNEITILDETREQLFDHDLILSVDFNQPWGSFNVSVAGSQYLSDPDKYRFQASSSLGVRLTRGLSLSVSGSWIGIRDQRNLPKRNASDEEILLYLRALATDYQYYTSISMSYTFGSIFNNIVNPRIQGWRRTR